MQKIFKRMISFVLAFALCFGFFAIKRSSKEAVFTDAAGDYYAPITATSGTQLLGQVHDLITTTHKKYTTYADCKNPTYVQKTDPGSNDKSIMEFYSQADMSSTWQSGASGTWNREHCWCQSLSNGLWGETGGGADLYHIRPTESRLNSTRSNNRYGVVNSKTPAYYKDTANNSILAGYNSGGVFEPLDYVKGDVARIMLYVYTHYNTYSNVGGTTNGNGSSSFFGTLKFTNVMAASSEDAAIKLLLNWHNADPVDKVETTRNDAVYAIQGNRNPFVDHPEYVDAIWGDKPLEGETPTLERLTLNKTSVTLTAGSTEQLTVTATPASASADVTWTSSNTAVATVSASGLVTAKSAGTATITATSKVNPAIKASATVTVEHLEHSWTLFTDAGNGTHSRHTTCTSHEPIVESEAHDFEEGRCLVCGAEDPDFDRHLTHTWTLFTDAGDGTHTRHTTCTSHEPIVESEAHDFEEGRCLVCGAEDPDFDRHLTHTWTLFTDAGNGTHTRHTTCDSHEPILES